MHKHNLAVEELEKKIRAFHSHETPFHIYHGSTKSTRRVQFEQNKVVDITGLSTILHIDKGMKTALVEPNVSMGQLLHETLNLGLIPAVVPPFPGITAGGAFAGTAAGSSSFKFGYFYKSVNWIEMLLGNGDSIRASPMQNSDLFSASSGSMGTLGVVTLLEVQLVPCHQYIRAQYDVITSMQEMILQTRVLRTMDIDFLDAIMFSRNRGVLISGTIFKGETKGIPIARFSRARDRWFFPHVHGKLECTKDAQCWTCQWTRRSSKYQPKDTGMVELVPVRDYLFRYDRGSFWLNAYNWSPTSWNSFRQQFLDSRLKSEFLFKAFQLEGNKQNYIIQNLDVPPEKAREMLDFLDSRIKIYPLWICPIKYSEDEFTYRYKTRPQASEYLLSIGVWGLSRLEKDKHRKNDMDNFADENRAIEMKLAETGGYKWLYAQCFYTHTEFWDLYERHIYNRLRERWKATTLPSVWDKVQNDVRAGKGKNSLLVKAAK
jgi:hypothetical protein